MTEKMNDRETKFARAFAILNVMASRVYEKGKPLPAWTSLSRLGQKPMDTLVRAHNDVMQYAYKFGAHELMLMDMLDEIVGSLEFDEFDNAPLAARYLHPFHVQQRAIDGVMGVAEGSVRWELAPGTLKNYCAQGIVIATKIGRDWAIEKNQPNPRHRQKWNNGTNKPEIPDEDERMERE
ncbi:hypothetical protein FLT15_17325 [Paenibacillus thiaminolyticus]|uniref:hypothetical protein n=1 Tax=Paenibacillus thiaminolyticus TaxID=49283 RepID=UPI001162FBC0|nr:hypothetical protein [Paenibacillus thiaminolyticus]NGP58133.1 hypothetical protein [Paenibacillus thiaminolyticus]NGP58776.1 hypothetical protein [Paenibacillus thiaminolyticus]NGP60038.1 hypothetical protein [Paenibacillus thiaminolyticus]